MDAQTAPVGGGRGGRVGGKGALSKDGQTGGRAREWGVARKGGLGRGGEGGVGGMVEARAGWEGRRGAP